MNYTILLKKLLAIEQSIGVEPNTALRMRLHDAQDYLLQMQREVAENSRAEVNWGPARRFDVARRFFQGRRTGTHG